MLGRGACPDADDRGCGTALHAAIEWSREDRIEVLKLLIAARPDLACRGSNDWTPLHLAAARDDVDAMRIRLDAGADPNVRTRIDDYATAEEEAHPLYHRSADFIRDYAPERDAKE